MEIITTATIADVERALANFKAAAALDPKLEGKAEKKLAAVVNSLIPKDDVTKDLTQAYTNGEKWHAVNAKKRLNGCTPENELEKIKDHILKTDAYARHYGNPSTKVRVEQWMVDKFPLAPGAGNA